MGNRVILLSIKPIYAKKIINGQKTVELRKRIPKSLNKGDRIVLYVSSPYKEICGSFTVGGIIRDEIKKLWVKIKENACISKQEFENYFSTNDYGYGILIDRYQNFSKPISLAEIKNNNDTFIVPQSYRYIKTTELIYIQR